MDFDENLSDFGCGLEEESGLSKNGAAFLKAYARTCTVTNLASEAKSVEGKREIIRNYLDFCYALEDGKIKEGKNIVNLSVSGKEFENITRNNLPNIAEESLSTLHLVEFFTHCCINCIHSIEDVRTVHEEIDEKFKASRKEHANNEFRGMKVLSVHSPKFPREKDLASIKAFCKRMRMEHSEVINDPECILWNDLGVTCWPTLLILGPNPSGSGPNLLFNFMGEDHKEDLLITISTAMEYFREKLVVDSEKVVVGRLEIDGALSVTGDVCDGKIPLLRFPGKVAIFGDRIIISDSGNNRLVISDLSGQINEIIGGSTKGCKNGNFTEARFYNPQGVAVESESVFYVADTGNHAVRRVDLTTKHVTTLVEPGHSLELNEERISLKSPWDVVFYDQDTLVVAAAGNHRLFGYFFSEKCIFGVQHAKNSFAVIAGSGREENRNNSYIMKASFAQPSGIAVALNDGNDKIIYIADSESSSIRAITGKGQVTGVVGGSRDPTDLFAFGDADGKSISVKLQHPMGVCAGLNPSEIFIADTYNHKIKKINVATKECQTLIANGLTEPSGIGLNSVNGLLYVADTNSHSIKIIDLKTEIMSEMTMKAPTYKNETRPVLEKYDKLYDILVHNENDAITLDFKITPLPDTFEGGQWKVAPNEESVKISEMRGSLSQDDQSAGRFSFTIFKLSPEITNLNIILDVFYCGPNSCVKRTRKIKVMCRKDTAGTKEQKLSFEWTGLSWDT